MATTTGQTTQKKTMNGDWKKIMFQVYGLGAIFIVAIGVIWQTVLLPQLRESQSNAATLREQIPKQTLLLEDIRDQGAETSQFQKSVEQVHEAQKKLLIESAAVQKELIKTNNESHERICDALENGTK